MDDMGQSYSKFNSSSDLANYLKTQLQKAGFEIKFEDLFGERQRAVVLDSHGHLKITDGWNPGYEKSFSFEK